MRIFTDPRAYNTISEDVIVNLHSYLKRAKDNNFYIVVCGAHHGNEIGEFISYYPNSTVDAFEAYPAHFNVLKNKYDNKINVNCYNYAVSDVGGLLPFYEISLAGSGSLLKFNESLDEKRIVDVRNVESVTLKNFLPKKSIDLLWVDVQGAELNVLKGTDLSQAKSLFLEVATKDSAVSYENRCTLDDLQEYLKNTHFLHSIGLDNETNNGTGNSFWLSKEYE